MGGTPTLQPPDNIDLEDLVLWAILQSLEINKVRKDIDPGASLSLNGIASVEVAEGLLGPDGPVNRMLQNPVRYPRPPGKIAGKFKITVSASDDEFYARSQNETALKVAGDVVSKGYVATVT